MNAVDAASNSSAVGSRRRLAAHAKSLRPTLSDCFWQSRASGLISCRDRWMRSQTTSAAACALSPTPTRLWCSLLLERGLVFPATNLRLTLSARFCDAKLQTLLLAATGGRGPRQHQQPQRPQ